MVSASAQTPSSHKSAFARWWPHVATLIILLVCCNNYYGDIVDKLPFGVHDWAQADRLALAINFYDNGMDFFHPATQNLASVRGIVGVEAPLQAYLAAAGGHLFGRDNISTVFRLLDILIAVAGLYFLFRAVFEATRDFVLSVFAPVFIFCSPVYVFYTGNYLPDPAAASICFIALYYLIAALRNSRIKPILAAIAFAALATLIKASTVSVLATVVCCGLWITGVRQKNRRHLGSVVMATLASGLLICASIVYMQYLNDKYQSTLFLSRIRPFERWGEFAYYIENYYKNYLVHEYFLLAQYPLYFLLLGAGIHILVRERTLRIYAWPLAIFVPAVLGIFYLFSKQYEVHDYYFISAFLPVTAYCLVVALIALSHTFRAGSGFTGLRTGLLCAMVITFFFSDYQASLRAHMDMSYAQDYSFRWSVGGSDFLRTLQVADTVRVVVANEAPPNLALVYFDRKGYVIPEDWHCDAHGIASFLDERSVKICIMRAGHLHNIRSADSTAVDSMFSIVGQNDNQAVLRRR